MTPVFADLGAVAPDINRMIIALGPFSTAAIPALESLGEAADGGTPAVKAALPVVTDLRQLARGREAGRRQRPQAARVLAEDGRHRARDGLRLLPGRPPSTASTRSATTCAPRLIVNPCSDYAVKPVLGCSANFSSASAHVGRGARRRVG